MKRLLRIAAGVLLAAACSSAPQAASLPTAIMATASAGPATTEAPTGTATHVATSTPRAPTVMTFTPTATRSPSPAAIRAIDISHAVLTYYDIAGSTANELRTELDSKGPVGYDGYKGDSTTKWFFSWDWPGYGSAACNLGAATVRYDIEVIFPRWMPPHNAAPELVARWNDYIRRLAEHEKGHVDFVVANYQTVADAIKGATCLTAEIAGQAALMPIRQHDLDYDADTQHGATQGARFP